MSDPKATTVYVVFREGVYMQGITGVYSSADEAEAGQHRALAAEPDDYHSARMVALEIDKDYLYPEQAGQVRTKRREMLDDEKEQEG